MTLGDYIMLIEDHLNLQFRSPLRGSGPLVDEDRFVELPIPDGFGIDPRTYGNTVGRHGRNLIDYFPPARRARVMDRSIHFDPEFSTFTYGDPTPPKAGLRRLEPGDTLIFYCGLEGWGFDPSPPCT